MIVKTFTQSSFRLVLAALLMGFSLVAFAQPANNDCSGATELTVGMTCTNTAGTNVAATASGETPSPSCGSFGSGEDVWYVVEVPAGGELTIEMSSGGGPTDFAMSIYSGSCGSLSQIECDDDDGPGLFPRIDLSGQTPGDDLYVRVWEWGNNATGAFNICATMPAPPPPAPANDLCANATTLTPSPMCVNTLGTNVSATPSGEGPAPSCSSFGDGKDVWYQVEVPSDGNLTLEMSSAGGPTDWAMSVYAGTCGALTEVECDDDDGPGLFPRIDLTGQTPGDILSVRVWEFGNNSFGEFNICAIGNPGPVVPPAPDPSLEPCGAMDVISLSYPAYPEVPVDTWLTVWSAATLTDVVLAGNPARLYENVNFLGIEHVGPNLIDASGMTHFNFHMYTPNMTTFRVKLVDFGADEAFGGGDDTEFEIVFEGIPQNEWIEFQIPLSRFPGMNFDNLAQLIFSGNPPGGGTFYLDNVYYSNGCATTVPVEFCVDLSCEAGPINAPTVAGTWNGFNAGANPISDAGDGIYCGVVDLTPGFYEYKFYYQPEFEMLMPNQACTNANANRTITVAETTEGAPLVAWESCLESVDCPTGTAITFCVDLTCEDNAGAEAIAFDFNAFNSGPTPLADPDGDGIWCNEFILEPGPVEYHFFYAVPGMAVPEDLSGLDGAPCTTNGANGVKRLYNVVEGVSETVTFVWESCDMSITECPPDNADITFCVDVSCVPGVEDVSIFGQFNGFNPNANPMDDPDGDGIYCTTINLMEGNQEYKFLVNGIDEALVPGSECTVTSGPFTNRVITVVGGMNETVTFGFGSCSEECIDPNEVEFCVDSGCLEGSFGLFGTFNGFAFQYQMDDPDGDGIYCTTRYLIAGDYEYKFTFNGEGETLTEGDPCTVTCCDGLFTNRALTVVDGEDQEITFAFGTCEESFEDVVFPDLTPVCGGDLTITLAGGATPTGGVYSGPGVTDNGDGETFNIDLTGLTGDQEITYTFTDDDLGCSYEATSTLTVLDCSFEIEDPCSCNDDASPITYDAFAGTYDNPNDGTFGEVVAIGSPAGALPDGLDFRVVTSTGAIGVADGDALTYDAGSGTYQIAFDHADDVGYTMTVDQYVGDQALGYNLMISNACAYPNPEFDPALDGIYCDFEGAVALDGVDADDINGPDDVSFTINGNAAMVFDPVALGPGLHTVVMTYDGADDGNGGVSADGGTTPAYRGCIQQVETVVEVEDFGPACIANVNVTLGEECTALITPEMVLTGMYDCADEIIVTVDGGDTDVISGCGEHTYSVEIFVADEMVYTCWGNIFAEDKTDPEIDCPADTDDVTLTFDAYEATGNLNAGDAELNFNNYSCLNQGFLADGVHNYDVVSFTTPDFAIPLDVYTFLVDTEWGDGSLFLFQGDFNEDNPCENIIGSSDDAFVPGGNIFDPTLRLSLPLQPNTSYTLVLTNWLTTQFGDWTIQIYSDDNSGVIAGDFVAVEVTETRDLICDDIDNIYFETPQSWVTFANGNLDFASTRDDFFGGNTTAVNAFLEKLSLTGIPEVSDNCGPMVVTLSDALDNDGDCGDERITRTFTVADRYDGVCIGAPRTASCDQVITFRKPTIGDLVFPPFVAPLECDEEFPVDANGNPHPSVTGYPWIRTAFSFHDLDQNYCNIGASYSDEPRIDVCEGTYKLRREWNIIDWCNPGGSGTINQLIKVGDFTGPIISGVSEVINLSTSPFACVANVAIPNPGVVDGNACGSAAATTYTVLAFGETFFAGGYVADGDVVQVPIGEHVLIICAEDACGNETCEEYDLIVTDEIEPTASCDDELNVSIGGGDVSVGIEGIARLFAEDVDEGSSDNCGEVTLEVRRNFWRNNTCDASANRWSPWGDFVDFYCCDIDNEITIELRVTDESGNTNTCWMTVTPEDKLNPYCYEPDDVTLTCVDLPLTFPGDIEAAYDDDFAGTSIMMSALFGNATGTDNCAVDTIVERTPNIQINECGWGTITRRFEAWQLKPEGDVNGNGAIDINEVDRSTNSCSQLITITEVHDFVIDFPEDADADCGDPDVPTIATETDGCDVLSINIGDPVIFSATGDECYKYSITYDVINWCLWDGEYTGHVLPRMTEDDGESLPIDRAVEANERPIVIYNDADGLIIDRDHERPVNRPDFGEEEGRWFVNNGGDSSIPNNAEFDGTPNLPNYGRYIYTQFVKVYDSSAPEVAVGEFGGPTDNCPDLLPGQFGDDDGDCQEAVSIPFSVSDDCELFDNDGNLVVSIVSAELDAFAVDANGDGDIKANEFVADFDVVANITDNGDGTYSFDGVFPIITSAMGDNVVHAVRILFEDGCGNQTSETIEFDVIDCKGPAPVCINGLTVTLMPQDDGSCAMAIWASDFEGSPISDCTGQGPEEFLGNPRVTKYAIYRASDVEADPDFVPSPDDTGLVLTQDDDETTVVYVYAFDEEGNYDYCETYVLVQQHVDCGGGTGTINGIIATEENETVEGVEVNVNGGMASMTTNADGTFSFTLPEGGDYTITPYLNANPLNGVSTFDLVLMSKHILGVQLLDSPYKYIAADVNNSQTITTLDMIQLRKLILNIDTEFQSNTSWRFVEAAYDFPVNTNPWFEQFPELINENNLAGAVLDADFVGVKIGDVNGSVQANALAGDDRNLNGQFNFAVANERLMAGNVYTVSFRGADMETVEGFQGTLKLQGAELVDIEYGVATAENFGLRYADQGMITASWNGKATSEDVLFSLVIRATEDVELSSAVSVNSRYTAAEAYGNGNTMNVGVVFSKGEVASAGFEVYQNTPNPFRAETMISFNLPADGEVTLTVNDAAGRVLTVVRGDYAAGYNTINLTKSQMQGASGVLSYTVSTAEYTATKSMIAVK